MERFKLKETGLLLCLFLTTAATTVANAQERLDLSPEPICKPEHGPPVQCLKNEGAVRLTLCRLDAKVAAGPDGQRALDTCIKSSRSAVLAQFKIAEKTIKKPGAKDALKAYSAALVSALDGIRPGAEETRIVYGARQSGIDQRLAELWARVEVELQ